MRKVIIFNLISLDGFFEGPDHDISWHNVDDEFNKFAVEQLQLADLLIFGKRTYDLMASYWPAEQSKTDSPEIAKLMNEKNKLVFSRSLKNVVWENTTLVNSDASEKLKQVKQQPGKDIYIFGSADLCSTFINNGLIDEYRIMINPVVLGKGTPHFKSISRKMNLKLVNSKIFFSGNVLLYYVPVLEM